MHVYSSWTSQNAYRLSFKMPQKQIIKSKHDNKHKSIKIVYNYIQTSPKFSITQQVNLA